MLKTTHLEIVFAASSYLCLIGITFVLTQEKQDYWKTMTYFYIFSKSAKTHVQDFLVHAVTRYKNVQMLGASWKGSLLSKTIHLVQHTQVCELSNAI